MKRLQLCGNDWNRINLGGILQSSMIRNRIVVRGKTIKWESNICIFLAFINILSKNIDTINVITETGCQKKEDI